MNIPNLHACMIETLLPNVQKGAAWLDETQSGWAKQIYLPDLRLESSRFCICGQLFGDYMSRPLAVSEKPEDYGFTVDLAGTIWVQNFPCDCLDCKEESDEPVDAHPAINALAWRTLDVLWSDEVMWRTEGAWGP